MPAHHFSLKKAMMRTRTTPEMNLLSQKLSYLLLERQEGVFKSSRWAKVREGSPR